jgi:hypothetical protein
MGELEPEVVQWESIVSTSVRTRLKNREGKPQCHGKQKTKTQDQETRRMVNLKLWASKKNWENRSVNIAR